ncbi:Serine/threonine protein kinase PrkC, regulator of stationary phase [Minicystis rosea]|nr:Serine/threonine protein kinase PrkC, regulator of stationary phase [Minicystis rosea]
MKIYSETEETLTGPTASSARDADPHHLLVQLGEGGTAQVFLAVQSGAEGVDKLVVLKVLKASLADSEDLRQMFAKEARFSAMLNHANIVQTIAIVQRAGVPAIVMEYLEGQSLSSILARTRDRIPLEVHLRIIIDTLRGLHYAHELTGLDGEPLNVVHRDVSPQNVFVSYDGHVKLIDFGIAKLAGAGHETATGVIKGKVRYMAPEQIRGQDLDRRVDIYAAGVLLWEAVTRERMWKGATEVTIMHHVLNGEIPDPRDVCPTVSEELGRITRKALAHDRDDRYATAAELEADLEAFLGSVPVTSRDVSNLVSREFAEIRAERKRIVNQELQRRATQSASTMPPPVHDLQHAVDQGTHSSTPSSPREQSTRLNTGQSQSTNAPVLTAPVSSAQPAPASKRSSFVAIGLVLVIGFIVWRTTAVPSVSPATPEARAASATLAVPEPSASASSTPAPPEPQPRASVTATASAPAASASAATSKAPDAPVGARRARPPITPPAPTPKTATPRRDCDPPFVIDAEGTKHFKAECF